MPMPAMFNLSEGDTCPNAFPKTEFGTIVKAVAPIKLITWIYFVDIKIRIIVFAYINNYHFESKIPLHSQFLSEE